MDHNYDFELPLSRRDYSALMDIRGLASGAHMMVMCAVMKDDGTWILQGSDADFDELLNDLNDEIDAGLAPKKNLPALRRIRDSVTPQDDDGL